MPDNKYLWTAKVGDKGQIVIPKEAREIFKIAPGDTLIIFGDTERGMAIAKNDEFVKFAKFIIESSGEKND